MKLSEDWIDLNKAVAHIEEHTIATHIAKRDLLNALVDARLVARGNILVFKNTTNIENRRCENIPEHYWAMHILKLRIDWNSGFATCKSSKLSDDNSEIYDEIIEFRSIEVSKRQLYKLWPSSNISVFDEKNLSNHPKKGVGGATGDFNWEKYLIEAAVIMYAGNPPPRTQSELIKAVLDKFGGQEGGPSDSQMKAHLGPLFKRFKAADEA